MGFLLLKSLDHALSTTTTNDGKNSLTDVTTTNGGEKEQQAEEKSRYTCAETPAKWSQWEHSKRFLRPGVHFLRLRTEDRRSSAVVVVVECNERRAEAEWRPLDAEEDTVAEELGPEGARRAAEGGRERRLQSWAVRSRDRQVLRSYRYDVELAIFLVANVDDEVSSSC